MSGLSRYEMETIINFNEEEGTASVYTHNKALRHKLEELAQERPEECRLLKVSHWDQAVEYYIPKSWVKITPPRQLSEAQREVLKKARLALKTSARAENQKGEATQTGKDTPDRSDGAEPGVYTGDFGEEA